MQWSLHTLLTCLMVLAFSLETEAQDAALRIVTSTDQPAVLLKNGHVLYGNAQQNGDRVVITGEDGGVVRLDVAQVACWGPNLQSLRDYRVDNRGKPSIKDHLAEASWCINHGLRREAAIELRAIYQLDPDNRQAQRLEQRLRDSEASNAQASLKQVTAITESKPSASPVFSANVIHAFTKTVQPILLNRCGRCHDSTKQLEFQLIRLASVSRVSSKITEQNLNHVLRWVDTDNPLESPLLAYAKQPHGGSKTAPLGKTHLKAFLNLQHWLATFSPPRKRFLSQPIGTTVPNPFQGDAEHELSGQDSESLDASTSIIMNSGTPQRLPPVTDPFDPEVFNRKNHN